MGAVLGRDWVCLYGRASRRNRGQQMKGGVLGGVKLSEPGCAYMAKPGQQWGEGKLIHNRVCLYDRAGAKVRGGKGVPSWLGEAQMGGRG